VTNEATLAVIRRFNEAVARADIDETMAAMTDDCLFDGTSPAPDGEAFRGQSAVRGFWESFFRSSPAARFTTEEEFAAGDRAVVLWRYDWVSDDGSRGHVRGVDVFQVRGGKIAEKRSYVKG
jgi:ketosteroid isomerase-like protein